MQTQITQTLLEKIPNLPLPQQQKVLEFVEDLEKKPQRKSLTRLIQEHFENIPAEDLEKLPTDAAKNISQISSGTTIWQRIRARAQNIPDEVWAQMPSDGAENHDRYLNKQK